MRQALGKLGTTGPGKPEAPRRNTYQTTPGAGRHRFRQDGEVPVVRLALGEGGRGGERQAHAPAGNAAAGPGQGNAEHHLGGGESVRQVQELTEQMRAAQTRLGHAELAAGEALKLAQARQAEAASLRQTLDAPKPSWRRCARRWQRASRRVKGWSGMGRHRSVQDQRPTTGGMLPPAARSAGLLARPIASAIRGQPVIRSR